MTPTFFASVRSDAVYYYSLSGSGLPSLWILKSLLNSSLRATTLFRLCARSRGVTYLLWRSVLIGLHGCDVASGAALTGKFYLPHPVGIVIGAGVSIGDDVWIYQGVTLGRDGAGGYPTIEDNVRIFPNCVVVGETLVASGTRVSALSFLKPARG